MRHQEQKLVVVKEVGVTERKSSAQCEGKKCLQSKLSKNEANFLAAGDFAETVPPEAGVDLSVGDLIPPAGGR